MPELTSAEMSPTERAAVVVHDADCRCGAYDPAQAPDGQYMRQARRIIAAAAPHIEAEALRAEAERTYLHTTIGQSGQRSYSHRNIHGERTRDALLKRAAEIAGGSDAG